MEEAARLADERRVGRVADDLLIGAASIAQEIGVNVRAVYLLKQTGRLPISRSKSSARTLLPLAASSAALQRLSPPHNRQPRRGRRRRTLPCG